LNEERYEVPPEMREGFLVSFDYSSDAMREIDRFFREEHRIIVPSPSAKFQTRRSRGSEILKVRDSGVARLFPLNT
jgi:hypothetical protein